MSLTSLHYKTVFKVHRRKNGVCMMLDQLIHNALLGCSPSLKQMLQLWQHFEVTLNINSNVSMYRYSAKVLKWWILWKYYGNDRKIAVYSESLLNHCCQKSLSCTSNGNRQEFVGEVDTVIFPGLKFLQDVVYQKLLKSTDFHRVIQK